MNEQERKELISSYLGDKMAQAKTSWRPNPEPKTKEHIILDNTHYNIVFLSDRGLKTVIAFCEKELERRKDLKSGTCFGR